MGLSDKFVRKDFNKIYRGTESFCDTKYYAAFINLLDNDPLLDKIKFANDILRVPPVETWIKVDKQLFCSTMSKGEKQGIGACFGYLFRFIYGNYEPRQAWVNEETTGIKTASWFEKIKEK